ncbi:class I tRNA ligase family protein [Candidatus Saccharibacteria bacterium]|nr:class I tRNA ligase family protein [Candidatus Saccharibacteria bacterium]
MLKLFNTASRKNENFKPTGEVVKIYTCGPTVYNDAHIGNLTAYIYWDLLVRCLRANGYKVKRVLNLTDVGHLVSDADEGEDKLEKGAEREGKTVWEVADTYIAKFKKDYKALELAEPEIWARATDYIEDDMAAVDLMTEHGFTYETADGVYYDTSKYENYAGFAKLDLAGLQAGARVGFSDEKHNVSDFAVWKFIKEGEKHTMRWNYLGRPGYPGWHLECATIIHKELGEPIDIHTGGIDHIPIHHTNEIAECFAAYGHDLSRFWLHCNFITIDGEKISKSLGNVYLLSDLAERGFSALDYKMWVLSGHYQGTRNFTFESLEAAKARRLSWRNRIAECYQKEVSGDGVFEKILEAVNNNLNSAEAYALIDNSELSLEDWKKTDELFGLKLIEDSPKISEELQALVLEREKAREQKNFARADEIRDQLAAEGITVKDTPTGPIWQYIR